LLTQVPVESHVPAHCPDGSAWFFTEVQVCPAEQLWQMPQSLS
jgi:hypothetical protein